jgi:hypothetical protein
LADLLPPLPSDNGAAIDWKRFWPSHCATGLRAPILELVVFAFCPRSPSSPFGSDDEEAKRAEIRLAAIVVVVVAIGPARA